MHRAMSYNLSTGVHGYSVEHPLRLKVQSLGFGVWSVLLKGSERGKEHKISVAHGIFCLGFRV